MYTQQRRMYTQQTIYTEHDLERSDFLLFHSRFKNTRVNRDETTFWYNTFQGLFFTVKLLMFLKTIPTAAHKTARFMGASIHLPILVHSHMLLQITRCDRRVSTARNGTFEGLFPCMRANVHLQIAVVRGGVRAVRIRALQRLLSGVGSDVYYEDAACHSCIVAVSVRTLVGLISGVRAHVDLHVTFTNCGVVATLHCAVELLRRYSVGAARAAVVIPSARTHRRTEWDRQCRSLTIRKELSWNHHQGRLLRLKNMGKLVLNTALGTRWTLRKIR